MIRYTRPDADPRVSVVMPYFNHGAFIGEALDSLRDQSRPPDEIIVIDDGSSDRESLEILDRLKEEGIVVLRQERQGPGAARNLGVENSSGEAILFLDSDDRVTHRHVEIGIETLRHASEDVGFVYPDLQFFGNEQRLVVMPPYNFYLLLFRNFCSMGGLVDRAVFDSGNQFRVDLRDGHEDWDFFITLGSGGIFGAPFHGAPLLYRRWGFSRSDGVEEKATFEREVRDLHPELHHSQRLVEIKQEWAPALSIVISGQRRDAAVAEQTCDDFELVYADGAVPRVRGRMVMLLDGRHVQALLDETFVERILRLFSGRQAPTVVALHWHPSPTPRWTRVTNEAAQDPFAVVMDGATFDQWQALAPVEIDQFDEFLSGIDHLMRAGEHLAGAYRPQAERPGDRAPRRTDSRPHRATRPPPRRPGTEHVKGQPSGPWPARDLAEQGLEMEQSFRHREAQPLFIPSQGFLKLPKPPGSFRDGLEAITERAWSEWMPARSVRLDLAVDAFGRTSLEVFDRRSSDQWFASGSRTRVPVGWLWTQPFPGTVGLFVRLDLRTHTSSYRLCEPGTETSDEVALGYASTDMLPGRLSLHQRLRDVSQAVHVHEPIDLSLYDDEVFVEAITAHVRALSGAGSGVSPEPPRRWPLYEISLQNGGHRYTCEPDLCVARRDIHRSSPVAVAEVGEYVPTSLASPLYEVEQTATGRIGYVGQVELVASRGALRALGIVGGLQTTDEGAVPLVRLRKIADAPEGELGHRVATAWKSLESGGYTPEGVLGFAWNADATRAPLYRWRDVRGTRHVSLGEDASRERPDLTFEGTLGAAWSPAASNGDYVDLWEMERGGVVSYASDPWAMESQGYTARRVIARLLREQGRGSIPLISVSSRDRGGSLVTTCREEGRLSRMSQWGVLGYLEAAVPARSPVATWAGETTPDWAVQVQMPDGAGGRVPGLLYRERVTDGIEAWGAGADGEVVHLGSVPPEVDGVKLFGFALGRLTPLSRPVYVIVDEESGVRTLALGTPYRSGRAVEGVAGFLPGTSPGGRGADSSGQSAGPGRGRKWTVPKAVRSRFQRFAD